MSVSNLPWLDLARRHHHIICLCLLEWSIYLFMKGSQQCFGMGRGHICVFSQDEIRAQLVQCVEQNNSGPDVADYNPEKPQWDLLNLWSWSTYFISCCLWKKGDGGHSQWCTFRSTCHTRVFQISRKFSHVGYGKRISVCLAKNIVLEGCLGMFPN